MHTENVAPTSMRSPAAKKRMAEPDTDSTALQPRGSSKMEATMKRLRSERDAARTELKTLEAAHTKATSQLAKHAKLLPTLQAKMEELSANHAESKKRKDAEIVREREARKALQDKYDGQSNELRAVSAELKSVTGEKRVLQSKFEDKSKLCDSMRIEMAGLKRVVSELRHAHEATAATVSSHLATLKAGHDAETYRLQGLVQKLSLDNNRLTRQLADKSAQFSLLATFCGEQQEQLDTCQAMLDERDVDVDELLIALNDEREIRVKEKDWRQRARSDERLIASQRDDLAALVDEREAEAEAADIWSAHLTRAIANEVEAKDRLLEGTAETLDELRNVNEDLVDTRKELETTKQGLAETTHALGKLQEEHDALGVEHDKLALDHQQLEGSHQELAQTWTEEKKAHDETRWQLAQSQKETEKEKTEKKRVVALLGMSRKATESLTRDLNEANDEMERLQTVDRENGELRIEVDTLARMKSLAEMEVEQIASQNVDLLSHGNANQKIRHIAALRNELQESKRANVVSGAALAAVKKANDELRKELAAYKPLDGRRSRATGPDMRDVDPYNDDGDALDDDEEEEEEEGERTKKVGPRRVVMFARRSTAAGGPVKKTGTMLLSELV